MKKFIIAVSLFAIPFVSFAGMTPANLNLITNVGSASYTICQIQGKIENPVFTTGNILVDVGYSYATPPVCTNHNLYNDYLHASWLETYRQLTGISSDWTASVAQYMAKYIGS